LRGIRTFLSYFLERDLKELGKAPNEPEAAG